MMDIPKSYDQVDQQTSLMFLCSSALKEINAKIEIPNNEFVHIYNYNPIEHVKSRLKAPDNIVKKLKRYNYDVTVENMTEKLSDIAGIRTIYSSISGIYQITDMISRQSDVTVLYVKNYIKNPEPDGYKSYHMVATIPTCLSDGPVETKVEIQIRTVAMDFWVSLERRMYYRFEGHAPVCLQKELKTCVDVVDMLDAKMYSLNEATPELSQDGQEEEKVPEPAPSSIREKI